MIVLLAWTLRALAWRAAGVWERRHMRRQPHPLRLPLKGEGGQPRIIIVAVRAHPDPHTATLRRHFATGAVPDGRAGPLNYQEYARIARAVRAEHQESSQ